MKLVSVRVSLFQFKNSPVSVHFSDGRIFKLCLAVSPLFFSDGRLFKLCLAVSPLFLTTGVFLKFV